MLRFRLFLLFGFLLLSCGEIHAQQKSHSPLILAHYMPWYQAKPENESWGWHWTMNHFDPQKNVNGRRQIASHFYPEIEPYDSGDEHVLECQLLQMKLAGIDGVIVDWYGLTDFRDYPLIHRNTQRLIEQANRLGMKFAICYEDQTIPALVKTGELAKDGRVKHAIGEIEWLQKNWFGLDGYVRLNSRPVLLSFGRSGLDDNEWSECIQGLPDPIEYFSQHRLRPCASGAFDWPVPKEGLAAVDRFLNKSKDWPSTIPVVFPRFHDIYEQANVHESWGHIKDDEGSTFQVTLEKALASQSRLIQIATWNDWGEGTVIEPSCEFGFRDLAVLQNSRRNHIDPDFAPNATDLELPGRLLALRNRATNAQSLNLDAIAMLVSQAKLAEARKALDEVEASLNSPELQNRDPVQYKLETDILYRSGNVLTEYQKQRCRLDVYYPVNRKDFTTVVWFHGGGLTQGDRTVPDELKGKGIAVVAVNYRLSPQVKAPAYIEDAAASVAWTIRNIAGYGGSSQKVFVSGHSAGGYLTTMVGLDKRWLAAQGIDANKIAGLVPFSGHTITHFTIRSERGIDGQTPIVDDLAPLFHVRKDAPRMLLITGDRDKEMLGRYEETAYFWRMMKVVGHPDTRLIELKGFDHGQMAAPAYSHLLNFIREFE